VKLERLPIPDLPIRTGKPFEWLYDNYGNLKPLDIKEYPMPEAPTTPIIKVGIEETKDAVKFFVSVANSVLLSWKDGFSLADIVHFAKPAMLLIPFLSNAKLIPVEVIDIDQAEFDELIDVVKTELNIEDEQAAKIVGYVLEIIKLIKSIIAVTNEAKA